MKKILTKKYVLLPALALLLAFSPMATFAKGNGHAKVGAGVQANATVTCPTKAYGHLIASGWLKANTKVTVDKDCVLPHGISNLLSGKKHAGGDRDHDRDRTAAVISDIAVTATSGSATVTFKTNEEARGTVFYGTNTPVDLNNNSTLRVTESNSTENHSIILPSLSASTKYFFVVGAKDEDGNISTSTEGNFTTSANI